MERVLDYKGRWRNKTVAFRVSEEEARLLDDLVALSGLTKQEYIMRRLLNREVVVQGNPRVYKALKNQMERIYEELKRLEKCSGENDEMLYTLQVIAITLNGMKENLEKAETELWKAPPDPLLEAVSKVLTLENPKWEGTATELVALLDGVEIAANVITRKLNVKADELYNKYHIRFTSDHPHGQRRIILQLVEEE